MNKIFKVIWSKSKQCYIVVSEIAKNKTGKKKIVVASILAALAMQSGMITEVMAADPASTRLADAAVAVGTNGVAIGSSAKSQSNQSVAIGYFSNAQAPTASPENPATAVGAGANADGAGTVALGLSANATGANAVALGGGSNGGTNKTEATAVETTAVGFNAKASNSRATAIGSGAASSGSDSIALGTSTVANSEKAIAIGSDSKATDIGTTALGRSSAATGASATALGSLASASGTTATAVGMEASATGNESVAVGKKASATSGRALAVGTNASATGATAVAVGSGAGGSGALGFAGSLNSTAGVVNTIRTVNYATTADGANAVALGFYANAKNSGVAVGQNALAATGGVAIGKGVLEDTGNNLAGGVVMGQDSATLGPYSLAMGFNAFASGSTSMAVGHTVSAQGAYAVAMGRKVSATGTSTAIGHHATASGGGLAIGSQDNDASNDRTTASAKGAVAIGKNTKATSEDAVAIGTNAEANRLYSVALGSGSTTATGATNQGSTTINGITYNFAGATGNPNMQVSVGSTGATRQIKNVAAGEVSATSTDAINGSQLYAVASAVKPLKYVSINSTATGAGSNVDNDGAQAPNSIAIGPSSTVTRQNSIAFGNNAQSLSDDSITIGRNAKAESGSAFTNTSRAIAIGANSKVATNVTQGIAIGSGSLTDEGAVVTGDQSIAIGGNVKVDGHAAIAIGGDDARKAAGQQVSYTSTNDVEVTGTLQTAIQNLTGYNLSNYKGTAASHAGVAYGTSALAGNAGVAIGTASDSMTRMNDKGQVVNNKPVTNAVAIGTGARANFDNSVAIGGGSNTDHYATKQTQAVIDGVEVKWAGGDNISPGDVVSFGAKGFERQLKNVAPGEVSQTSTDAINGSQIYSLARKVTNIMNGGAGSLVNVNASGEPLTKVVTGTGANKQEKYYRTVDVKDDGTLNPGAVAQTPKSLALVNVDEPNVNQQTQTPRTLGNVANGVKDNDAVNVSQLKAATVKYFSVNSTDAGNRDNTGATGTNAIAIGPTAKSTGDNALAIGNNAQANSPYAVALGHYANNGSTNSANSVSIGFVAGGGSNGAGNVAIGSNAGKQVTGNNNISLGNTAGTVLNNNVYTSESILLGTNARVTGSTSSKSVNSVIAIGKGAEGSATSATALGINANASAENAMALGPSSKATAYNGVALGSFSEANTAGGTAGYNVNTSRTDKYAGLTGLALTANTGAVSIGNATTTRQITNLAAGTNDTDAVNVAQLKSVNLAVKGNSGAGGDVNLATNPLTIKGNDNYITTSASGNTVNISGKVQNISVSNGTATAAVGMADAKNVAEAINNAVSQNAYTWNLTADNDTAGSRSTITKEGTVKFSGDQNITVKRDGNTISSSLNKSITVDSVKANNSVTTGSGSNQITLDGTTGAVTGKTFSGQSFTAGNNVLSNTTLQIGSPTNGDNNVTITKDGLTSKAGTKTAKFGANGIDAGGQQIANVSSGGNVGTNAANITDVKNAVSDVTLKLDTNSKAGTVKLSESPLKVIGANGIRTDLVGTNNGSLVVGLDQATVNATTKGIGLTGDTGSTGNKYLKDGDVSFAVTGDGNLVSTSATTAGVKVAVNAAKVKDLAVEAVTVSKDTQADNPITVTPTAGTNSKDYAIGIDTTKLAGKTDLTYRANNDTDANAQKVSLAKGLNFVNGDNTVATVAVDGKVSYDLNAATKTKINDSATAVARNISLGADSGTASSQSLKDGDVAFNVKGATGDYVSTNMNGNTVEISTTRATINSDANTGAASVTGNDGLATAKNVADAINKAADAAKAGSAWNLSANGDTSTKVSGGDTVEFTGDNNITVDRNNKTISTSLNKNLTDMNSISLVNPRGETIFLNGRDGSIQANKAEFKDNAGTSSTITSDQLKITNGLTDDNEHTTAIALGTISLKSGPNSSALDSKNLSFSDEDGNNAEGNAKGFTFQSAAGKQVEFGVDEIKAGGNKIQEVAEGTADTDAVNVKQLKDTVASQTLTYRANTAADADAKSVKLSKGLDFVDGTMTKATVDNDGKVTFDINDDTKTKINDSAAAINRKVSLGADSGTPSSQSLKDGDVAFNVKGATGDYVSTNMNGNTVEISTTRATINSDANTGAASVTGNDGLATAKNVADAINKAADAAKAGAAWNLTTNSSTTDKTSVQGGDTVDLINGDNILITQDGTDKKKITVATKKDLTVDSVTAGNTVINTSGLTNGTTAITGSGITTDKVTVGGISIDKTDGINAGGKAISNVASGGTTDTNAANIGDVKQAVANLSQNLNITDGTNNGTVDLKNQKLNVAGANGVTATVNNQTITVGLDADTVNATTKGIGLTADTGSTGNKYLKDGDVSFAVTGDGNLVSTSATAAGVKVAVDAAKVKDLAVDAVTVSKDTQADNPITVTPTAGTNSKDYAIGIDTTKLAAKTDLTYRANNDTDANAKKVSLAKGLNFVNGTLTTASIDTDGVVKYDVNTASITAGADGTVTGPTTDGVATAQNVADAINAAKKASKTEITANTGEAANATTGNVTLTSTTAADGHTIYDVKLNDTVTLGTGANAVTIDGTAGKVTAGSAVVDGVNNTITTGGANAVSLDGAAGTVTGLTNKDWTPGVTKAVTGRAATEDQLQKVADAASSQTWNITADKAGTTGAQTGTKKNATVGKDQTVELVAGDNLTINQDERKFTYSLNKDLAGLTSVSVGDGTTETINLDGATGKITAKNAVIGGVTVDGDNSHVTGLSNTTWNGTATTGRAATEDQLKAVADTAKATTDAVNLKFSGDTNTSAGVVNLKDDTFNIVGDGKYVTTDANGKDLTVKVSEAEVKKSAVAAVTVSTDTTDANNPISVTPTTSADGTTKDYKVTIDGTKIANKTNLSYKANDGTAKQVSLADGLNFKNGTLTTASIDDAGVVKYDVNTAAITAGTDGTVTGPTTDGVATAQNVADAINAAKKAAKTEITANTGEAANATTGNVTLTSTTAADGHTIYDVKLNDKVTLGTGANAVTIDGTAGKATVGTAVVDGVNNTITTGGANAVALDGAAGTVKTGTVTVTGGTTNDITGLSNTTVTAADFATKGRAATEEQLKAVGEQTWKITADKDATTSGAQTGTKKDAKVGKDDKVQLIAGENLTVNQNERDFTYSLNKDLVKMNSATFEATGGKTTVITGDSIAQTDGTKTNTSTAAGNTVADGGKSTATTADGTTVTNGADSTATTAAGTTVTSANGNTNYAADGVRINTTGKNPVSLTDAGLDNGNNVIKNVASGHVNNDDTDNTNAANIADVKKATTTVTANNGEAANATTGNVTLTSTTAADGHTIYDVKLNDKVTLGTGANAVTIDGTAGKATVGTAVVDGVNNTITTGGANAVALDGAAGTVKTGTVTVTGGTTNDITGLSNTTVTAADFATKGRAATEEQLKVVGEQTWQITADKDATTSGAQTGTKKDAKVGKDDKVQLIAGENLTVNQNERDFTYSLNKDLVKMNSATFEATGGKTTVITGDSIAQTDGTKTNRSTAAGNTVADGAKSTATTADGTTVTNGADSTATTAAGTTVTSANGNTNYAADGVRINTTGKNPVSLTDAGLDNGNNVIKNVASGHVNNDDTDNTNAANIADVKKATTTVTANNGEAANATTGNVTLTSTTAADGHTIYDVKLKDTVTLGTGTNAVTIDGTAGKVTAGSAVVDGVNNTITTGGANAVVLNGADGTVKTGTVTVTGGTTNDITGLSNTTVNSADFATKGRAATEEQLKQVGEQTWQITADKDTTTSGAQTGTKKDAKVGKDDKVQLIAGENLTVNQNERDFTYSLNKDLVKMNSATFEATGGKTTVITGDSIAQTDGTKTNRSTAAGNTVADGTKSTETTAAGQVIKDGAKTNTSTVDENTLVDGAKSNKTTVDSNVIDDGNGNVNTSNATSNTITDGTNTSTITAGKAQIGTVGIDGVTSKITTGGANAVVLNGADGTVKTGTVTLTGGTTNDITGLSNTTVNSADFATKGRAATEEQLKQVGEQTWQITADKDATTSGNQTGTKKDAKVGKDDKVQLIAGENLTVNQNERDFTYSLNKDLVKMNSATFEATGGKTTVITGDSIAQTDGTKTNRSTAAGNTVADGTKSTETTAAGQVIKDGAKTNTSTVDENTLVDGTKSNKTTVDSNVIDDGNGNVNTSKATSNTITDGTNTTEATASTVTVKDNAGNSTVITKDTITTGTGANKVTVDGTAGKVTAGSAVIDGVNNTITTGGANAVKLDGAAGTVTGLTNTAWTPGVTKAVSGRAATEDQLQQVSDAVGAGWNINSGAVAGSTGEANGSAKTKISSGEEVQLQAGNNLIIDQNGKTLAYSLNKNLKDMESAIFNATGGKTTVIKGDSIVQTDGGKTNTSNAAGNTVVDGTKSTATTAAGTTITDGAKTNTNTADKNVIDDGAGNTNTSNATSNTIADPNGNTNTATATSNTLADNAGNSNVSNATSNNLTDNAGNSNVSNATSNTLKNTAGDETKVDAKGATVKDAAGNTTNVAATGATVTNAAGDTTKVEATGTTVADAAGNKATFTKDGVTITKPGKDTVSLTGNGLDNGNNKIVNVADGTNDTDAVNVRQLDAKTKAATTELTANGGESADNTTGNIVLTKTTAPDGHIIYDNKLNDKITLGAADPTKAITVDGTNGTIKAGKDGKAVAINGTDGTIKVGDGTNAVAIDGVNGSVKVADKIALNGKDGKATIGTVGIDGKDGIITTGGNNPVAVSGKDGVVTGLTNKTWDPNNITSGRAATEDQVQSAVANAGWDATVGTEGSGVNSTPSATPEKIRPNETLTFKAGNNMMVSHAGKTISYAVNPELTDMKSATFKDAAGNTTVTNGNGITITPGSANPNNPNAGPVSLTKDGLNNGNNQIKGVAPGSDDTDAVNIGQLKASNAKMGDAIGQVAGEVQRVGAHAAAMAALKPIQYDPLEPTQIMAGVGNYRGETAAALGLAHYTNEDTMFNVGVSVGGNHNMVNAGVTHKFGSSPEKKNIPDRYKAGPISSVYVMQDEVSSLKKENAEQKYVIADQAARLNTLEAENERQRQELAETKQGLDDLRAAVDKLLASKG